MFGVFKKSSAPTGVIESEFARVDLLLVDKAGSVKPARIVIGRPRRVDDSWQCPIDLDGIVSKVNPSRGSDSFQALLSAIKGIRQVCKLEIRGRRIFIDESGDGKTLSPDSEMSLAELFGD